jgi:hypothetical protein
MNAAADPIPEPPNEGASNVLLFRKLADRVVESVESAPSIGAGPQDPNAALSDIQLSKDLCEGLLGNVAARGVTIESAVLKDPYDGGMCCTITRARAGARVVYLALIPGFILNDPTPGNRSALESLRLMFPPDSVLAVLSPELREGPHMTYDTIWKAWATQGLTVYFVLPRYITDLEKNRYNADEVARALHFAELLGAAPVEPKLQVVPAGPNPLRVFCSYARDDSEHREKLEGHLSSLEHENLIAPWSDRDISAGMDWEKDIHENLETADIILLLISDAFMRSQYIFSYELTVALQRQADELARVIPIIVRPVDWQHAPFGKLQALPGDRKGRPRAVTDWRNRDSAWMKVAEALREVIGELRPAT